MSQINAPNLHIRMISEGSCDAEDWRMAAENSALPSEEYILCLKLKSILK